jgi:hypothetical protein
MIRPDRVDLIAGLVAVGLIFALYAFPTAGPEAVSPASAQTKQGMDGFRFFAVEAWGLWVVCDCGWRPDLGTHYRPAPSLGSGADA